MDDFGAPPPYSPHDPNLSSSQGNRLSNGAVPPAAPLEFNGHLGLMGDYGRAAGSMSSEAGSNVLTPTLSGQSLISPTISETTDPPRYTEIELEAAGFASAVPYFEMRPPPSSRPACTISYHAVIKKGARPDSVPFPEPRQTWWRSGVDAQDWMTFVNHLIPVHIEDQVKVAGQTKLEAEAARAMRGLKLQKSRPPGLYRDRNRSSSGLDSMSPVNQRDDTETDRLRRLRIDAVTAEWNSGFFGPRGLKIVTTVESNNAPMVVQARTVSREEHLHPGNGANEDTSLLDAVANRHKKTVRLLLDRGDLNIEARNKKGETALFIAVSRGDTSIVEMLLEKGANPTHRPPNENTPLYIAVSKDRTSILKLLLQNKNVDIDAETGTGETALYRAVARGSNKSTQLLLENGASVEKRPFYEDSMLNIAVSRGDTSIVKMLLENGAKTEEKDAKGNTPLCRSVKRGDTSITKLLLQFGAETNVRTGKGISPLCLAVSNGNSSIVSLLLQNNNVDLEDQNLNGETPLCTAILRGDTSIADLLLKKGAKTTARPGNGETLLNRAVSQRSTSLTSMLLEHGAEVEIKNGAGETPLCHAVLMRDTSIVSLLLKRGADVNTKTKTEESLLYKAVCANDTSIVSLLLEQGADPEVKTPSGDTPLYRAVCFSNSSLVSLLLKNGANPNTTSPTGESVLFRAVYRNNTSMVSLLLGERADPESKSHTGETVLFRAVWSNKSSLASLLLEKGANPDAPGLNGFTPRSFAEWKGNKSMMELINKYAPANKSRDLLC